jgi:outer membrane receptor for ferric coprogen and ferric-rhodotorulic acid
MRNMKDWDKIVEKARSFLNKMAHDFGDFYKGKLNAKWHDAMQALDRMEGNNGK